MVAPVIVGGGLAAAIGAAATWALRIYAVSILGKILMTIGVGLFLYNFAVPEINSFIGAKFTALPEFLRHSVAASGIDKMITMIVSAYGVRAASRVFFGKRAEGG